MEKLSPGMKMRNLIQIILLFVLPVLLFYFGDFDLGGNLYWLFLISVLVTRIVLIEGWSLEDLGIRLNNFKSAFLLYALFTVVIVAIIVLIAELLDQKIQNVFANPHFKYGFVLLSFFQEFLFRSFLINRLRTLTKSFILIILVDGILFGFLHIIFPNPILSFLLSSILGFAFAAIYYFRPNLILATLSHAVINFVAVYYCFVSINEACR